MFIDSPRLKLPATDQSSDPDVRVLQTQEALNEVATKF
jgi:hypothetical protein